MLNNFLEVLNVLQRETKLPNIFKLQVFRSKKALLALLLAKHISTIIGKTFSSKCIKCNNVQQTFAVHQNNLRINKNQFSLTINNQITYFISNSNKQNNNKNYILITYVLINNYKNRNPLL